MYEAFDSFLDIDTWHTRHENDEKRFFAVLKNVVGNPGFNPDAMGNHMRQKLGLVADDENDFREAIEHYTDAAWAVKTYLSC